MSEASALPSHGSYLLPHLEHATVADAMHPGILSCDAEATLTEVARIMSTHHVHCIVVRRHRGRPRRTNRPCGGSSPTSTCYGPACVRTPRTPPRSSRVSQSWSTRRPLCATQRS